MTLSKGFEYYPGEPRPIWFVYSGMGSQWPGMGADLMKIPIFAQSVERLLLFSLIISIAVLEIYKTNIYEFYQIF